MWKWKYESCSRCGINYRMPMLVNDEIWLAVNGKEGGCLCANCFIQIAQEKSIDIQSEYIERLYVFDPDRRGFNIIDRIGV